MRLLLGFYLSWTLSASALIYEAPHFSDLIPHATEEALIVLDIDDTLLIPVQTVGTDMWFQHIWKE